MHSVLMTDVCEVNIKKKDTCQGMEVIGEKTYP